MSELKGPSTKTTLQRGWIGLLVARVIHKKKDPADTSYREAMTKETPGGMEGAAANGTFRRRSPPARSWAIKKGGRLSVAHLFGFGCGFTGRLFGFGCLLLGSLLCL